MSQLTTLLLILTFIVTPSFSEYSMSEEGPVPKQSKLKIEPRYGKKEQKRVVDPESEVRVVKRLARRYAISREKIEYLRSIKLAYEEIVPSLIISQETGSEVSGILRMRLEGLSWQRIADKMNINLDPLNKEVLYELNMIETIMRKARRSRRRSMGR